MVWAIIIFTTLMLIASLGVDYGRVQLAKTQLLSAADAAARAGAAGLATSAAQARSNAIAIAAANTADSTSVSISSSDIDIGNWSGGAFTTNGLPNNAVRVRASRTAANGNAIPLLFARMMGVSGCDIHASSVAMVTPSTPGGLIDSTELPLRTMRTSPVTIPP